MKKLRVILAGLVFSVFAFNVVAQDVAVFPQLGHTSEVYSVAFSPDGRHVVSGAGDSTIKLWNVATGREIRTFSGHSSNVFCIAFSPDGRQVISGSYDETIKIWDVTTGREIKTIGHTGGVGSVAFSPDAKQIISSSFGGTIKIWDAGTSREIRNLEHTGGVSSIAFSPDGKQIISGSYDKTIKLWDLSTGREIRTFSGHGDVVNSVAFSPDGRQILSGSSDKTIKLWDLSTGREIRTFSGHGDRVSSVVFSPNGRQIISGSSGKTLKLWDLSTGREIRTFSRHEDDEDSGFINSVMFNSDGSQVISSYGNTIKLWEASTGREIRTFSGYSSDVFFAVFSSDGRQVISSSWYTVKFWDLSTGREIRTFSGNEHLKTFSPDGRQVISSSFSEPIKLWDLSTGSVIRTFSGHTGYVGSVAFSPDGRQIISGSEDKTIKLWDTLTGREIRTFSGNNDFIGSLAFSPDGRQVISSYLYSNHIKLWDASTGREIRTFSGQFFSLAFSPDSRQIISGSDDKTIKLYDLSTGRVIGILPGHTGYVSSLVFSSDGRQIISGSYDGTIKLWDASTGREIRTLSGHLSYINSVAFSTNGTQILSGSSDGTTRLWNTATGREIAQFISFTDGEWIVITPDGYYNASPNGDRHLNVRVGNNVYGIDQYKETFYRPQIVEARLQGRADPVRVTTTIQTAGEPPSITIRSPSSGSQVNTAQAQLSVLVEDQRHPIRDVRVLVNGRLVGNDELSNASGTRGITIRTERIEAPANQRRVEINLPVTLIPGTNRIQIIATNNNSLEATATVEVIFQTTQRWDLPNLWILSVGVNRYDSPDIPNLSYAVNDAREIVNAFKAQEGRRFGRVNSLLITDDSEIKPTAANIIDGFDFLSRASQHDIILLFMAGHGITNTNQEFYFVSSDSTFANGQIQRSRAVSQTEIMRVRNLPGQKLIFIDACHAGAAGGNTRGLSVVNSNHLIRQIMEPSTVVFMSSRGMQESLEFHRDRHGIFTYAILQGLRGAAFPDSNGNITMKALDMYVSRTVPELTNGQQHPQSTVKDGNYEDFVIAVTR
ncbi:MAG: caspase family protein [Treponema sp.]|nr:caspase family protein [Treponema sp.]